MDNISWNTVKSLQSKSYRGEALSEYEQAVLMEAHKANPEKYAELHQEAKDDHWSFLKAF